MSKAIKPDYDHWISMTVWTMKQSYLLLHGHEPNDPVIDDVDWLSPSKAEYKTRQKIYAAKYAGDLKMPGKLKRSFRPMELLKWASDSKNGIHIPTELYSVYKHRFEIQSESPTQPLHGNIEYHASKREQVLGAALAVIQKFPELSGFKNGKLSGTKIATLIEQNADKIWSEDEEIPLGTETMQKQINRWLGKLVPASENRKVKSASNKIRK